MGRIAEETVQRVAEANDIVEVIGSYFPLKRAGSSWRALCPFHREKSPSFYVNPQRQTFKCFGCGAGGSVFRFLMDYEHLDFPSAVKRLAQRAGIPVVEEAAGPGDNQRQELRKRLLALHADAASWFHAQLLKSPAAQPARDYLKSRGISAEVAKAWLLGYAPDSRDALLNFLKENRYSPDEIIQSGVASPREDAPDHPGSRHLYARFRGRVMFPIRNDYGEVIAFSGRVLQTDARVAKYVNSPETPLFTKGRVLYGLDKSKRALIAANTAIVCEGQLDLISAFEAGIENVIAPQGTAFTPEQARLLRRFVETVILCFDSDRAGQEAITRSLPALLECELDVRVARLPAGEDPDSLIRTHGPAAFRDVVDRAKNVFDHALEVLADRGTIDTPAGKTSAAKRLGAFVALMKDPVLRETTAKKISSRLGITEAAFSAHLKPAAATPSAWDQEPAPAVTPPLALSEGIRQLCRLALMDADVREWLRAQPAPAPAELGEGGAFLEKILSSPLPLHTPAARAAFAATLSPSEEAAFLTIDLDRKTENSLVIAQNSWFGLAAAACRAQRDAAHSRLRETNLDPEERKRLQVAIATLTKQILDLQSHLNEG